MFWRQYLKIIDEDMLIFPLLTAYVRNENDPMGLFIMVCFIGFFGLIARFTFVFTSVAGELRDVVWQKYAARDSLRLWAGNGPLAHTLAEALAIEPSRIADIVEWTSADERVLSFRQIRLRKYESQSYWIGYYLPDTAFPKFDLQPKDEAILSDLNGWRDGIRIAEQTGFNQRYILKGDDTAAVQRLFAPDICVQLEQQVLLRDVSLRGRSNWLFFRMSQPTVRVEDSILPVAQEIHSLVSYIHATIPVVKIFTELKSVPSPREFVGLNVLIARHRPSNWDTVLLPLCGIATVVLLLALNVILVHIWDAVALRFVGNDFLFFGCSIAFLAVLLGVGEGSVRLYRQRRRVAIEKIASALS